MWWHESKVTHWPLLQICFILDLWCSSHCQRASAAIVTLCVYFRRSLRADHFRNRYVSFSVCPLNNWAAPACPLPWPPSRPPNPLPQAQGPQDSASDRCLALRRTGCHFLPPHTKPVIAPGPQTRNNYLQNHAWVFKHAPSSCGHGIWQILLSPKSFHQEKGPPSFLVEAFALASLLSLNKYLRETQSQWGKSLKCQPRGKCRSRDLADSLQELHFRDRPFGGGKAMFHTWGQLSNRWIPC